MATDEPKAALRSWTVEGRAEDGAPEVTVVELVEDPRWTPEADDAYRYHARRTRGDDGEPFDVEGFDDLDEATSYARDLVAASREEYRDEEKARRSERRRALLELVDDWHADGDDARAVRAIAATIGRGRAGRILAALESAGGPPDDDTTGTAGSSG